MKKQNLWTVWKIVVVALLGLVCVDLFFLSREVIYRGVVPDDEYNATFEIDVCYRSSIEKDNCRTLERPDTETPKKPFPATTCDFEDRLGCYTKDLKEKPVSEILALFRNCNISDWTKVRNETDGASIFKQDLMLFNGFVCVKYKFKVHEKEHKSRFSITSPKKQPFDIYATYSRDYEHDGKYKTKNTHLFERACWLDEDQDEDQSKRPSVSYRCTERGKELIFSLGLYSAKHLEHPFSTDCVHRTDSSHRPILQYDCYETCVKKERKYHLLTYEASENFSLEYGKTRDFAKVLDKCADLCHQEDCQATGVTVKGTYEKEEEKNSDGRIILKLTHQDYRTEAIPLMVTAKLVWMVSTSVMIFFGANFYQLLMRPANLIGLYDFATGGNQRRKKNRKLVKITAIVAILALGLALALESILFDFGRENNMTILRKDSVKERSVSVSVCFSICAIIKDEFKLQFDNCTEKELAQKWTIGELDKFTWNVSDFKKKASMRNRARPYPIRQDDFPIPHFFRGLEKCFLLYYDSKNQWPHFSMQKYSRIRIHIAVPYTHFFIEDGHNYPGLRAKPMRKSVLHQIKQVSRRPRDGCVDFQSSFGKTKDELIRLCILTESVKFGSIPVNVILKLDDEQAGKYSGLKFSSDPDLLGNFLRICEDKFRKPACNESQTKRTYQDIFQENGTIVVDMTPYIYETKPFDDENGLIVANRILSFLLIFTGFSVREFSSALVFCFFNLSLHNSQLKRRLFLLLISLFFLLNFCFLLYSIAYHPMLEFAYNHFATNIEPSTRLRFCFVIDIDLSFDNYTLEDLKSKSLNFSDLFESLLIYDDDNKATRLSLDDFSANPDSNVKRINPEGTLPSVMEKRAVYAPAFYIDEVKCYSYFVEGNKTNRNLNVHYHRLKKLYRITSRFRNATTKRNPIEIFFIFINQAHTCDFSFNKPLNFSGDYLFEFTVLKMNFQDDYFHLKNLYSSLRSLVGRKPIDNPVDYMEDLRDSFIREQYATTNRMPMFSYDADDEKGLSIKNKQFDYYIQFRAIATKRNDFDFTKNTERIFFKKIIYQTKSAKKTDKVTLNVKTGLITFQEVSRNRYRYVECFLHLFVLIAFWFGVNLWTLPASLASAYPFCKYFLIYSLYYLVSFLVYLFDLWFAFARFLKFKID